MIRSDILEQEENIRQWVSDNLSKREIARRLKCNIDTLERYLKLMGIEYHGKQNWSKGLTFNKRSMSFHEYVNRDGVNVGTNKIRLKLLREGLKEHKCESCGSTEWQGQPIPLEVHHIDGYKNNNNLSNLQLLCPNCHALTANYRGKNIKKKHTAV